MKTFEVANGKMMESWFHNYIPEGTSTVSPHSKSRNSSSSILQHDIKIYLVKGQDAAYESCGWGIAVHACWLENGGHTDQFDWSFHAPM